jgi:hypothetical protein
MKTKIEHCKHFNPKTMKRRKTCPMYVECASNYKTKRPRCTNILVECLGKVKDPDCEYYED